MNMPALSIIFGFVLSALGGAFFIATGSIHKTALIPTYLGIVIFLCGAAAIAVPKLRMHVMHVAALLGLIGTAGGLGMSLKSFPKLMAGNPPQIEQLAMGVISLVFVALCVKSFIDARRARKAAN
ncbi:MAG TPA: hypothetical protein VIM61_07550 [Chthoniobacterales bacterium]|jgi:hypothetical protein